MKIEEYSIQEWKALKQPEIVFGLHTTPLAKVCIALWNKKLCGFFVVKTEAEAKQCIKRKFPISILKKDSIQTQPFCDKVMQSLEKPVTLSFILVGTPFQRKVWKSLLNIPLRSTTTYGALANAINKPKAVRAVGTAVGANPLCFFVPCHRVLPKQGGIGNYGPGSPLKERILIMEGALGKLEKAF